jgi:transcriptional regulator with XRE-family HTH domain
MKIINISKNIRKFRLTKDITQGLLGSLIGVSAASISSYENAESYPNLIMMVKLAEVFNISLDKLVY